MLGEPDKLEGIGGIVRRDLDAVLLIHRQPVTTAAAKGDPGAAALLHERVYSGRYTAGRGGVAKLSADQVVDVRLAVGDNDQLVVPDLPVDQELKFFPCPSGFTHHHTPYDPLDVAGRCRGLWVLYQGLN